jgi:hypothetical protein
MPAHILAPAVGTGPDSPGFPAAHVRLPNGGFPPGSKLEAIRALYKAIGELRRELERLVLADPVLGG